MIVSDKFVSDAQGTSPDAVQVGSDPLRIATQTFYYKLGSAFFQAFALRAFQTAGARLQARMLDLGCGNGSFAVALLRLTNQSQVDVGTDISRQALTLSANKRIYRSLICADAMLLPFSDGSFQTVFSHTVLCCMDRDLPTVFKEVCRVLKPGGEFVFTVATPHFNQQYVLSKLLSRLGLRAAAERYRAGFDRRMGHVQCLAAHQWKKLTREAGFVVSHSFGFLDNRLLRLYSMLVWAPVRVISLLKMIPFAPVHQAAAAFQRSLYAGLFRRTPLQINSDEAPYILIRALKS
jgi:ubiquinone/menaquinone biosynthesis C-methylase UbiE